MSSPVGVNGLASSPTRFSYQGDEALADYHGESTQLGSNGQAILAATQALASSHDSDSEAGSRGPSRASGAPSPSSDRDNDGLPIVTERQLGYRASGSPLESRRVLVRSSIQETIDQTKVKSTAEVAAKLFANFLERLAEMNRVLDVMKMKVTVEAAPLAKEKLQEFIRALTMGIVGRLQGEKEFRMEIGPLSGDLLGARLDPLVKMAVDMVGFAVKAPPHFTVLVTREAALVIVPDSIDKGNDDLKEGGSNGEGLSSSPSKSPLKQHLHSFPSAPTLLALTTSSDTGGNAGTVKRPWRTLSFSASPVQTPRSKAGAGSSSSRGHVGGETDLESGLPVISSRQLLHKGRSPLMLNRSNDHGKEVLDNARQAADALTKKLKKYNQTAASDEKYRDFQMTLTGMIARELKTKSQVLLSSNKTDSLVSCAAEAADVQINLSEEIQLWITKEHVALVRSESSGTGSFTDSTDHKDPVKVEKVEGSAEYKKTANQF